jgi:hypothetical protein
MNVPGNMKNRKSGIVAQVALTTWEVEIWRIVVQGQLPPQKKKIHETPTISPKRKEKSWPWW